MGTERYQLLNPYSLFDVFKNFIMINLSASKTEDLKQWNGYVQSKLRILTNELQPFVKIRPWPKAYEYSTIDNRLCLMYLLGIAKRRQLVNLSTMNLSTRNQEVQSVNLIEPIEWFKTAMTRSPVKTEYMNLYIQRTKKRKIPQILEKIE